MAKIQWKKDDVIKKFQEAIAGSQPSGRPKVLQDWLARAKAKMTGKPIEGEGEV